MRAWTKGVIRAWCACSPAAKKKHNPHLNPLNNPGHPSQFSVPGFPVSGFRSCVLVRFCFDTLYHERDSSSLYILPSPSLYFLNTSKLIFLLMPPQLMQKKKMEVIPVPQEQERQKIIRELRSLESMDFGYHLNLMLKNAERSVFRFWPASTPKPDLYPGEFLCELKKVDPKQFERFESASLWPWLVLHSLFIVENMASITSI